MGEWSQLRVVFVSGLLNNCNLIGSKRLACFRWDRLDCLRRLHVVCFLAVHADCGRSARHSWCSRVLRCKVVCVRLVACACTGCGGKFGWDAHDASLYVVEVVFRAAWEAAQRRKAIVCCQSLCSLESQNLCVQKCKDDYVYKVCAVEAREL